MTLLDVYRHPRAALRSLQAWLLRRRVIPPLPSVEELPHPVPSARKSKAEREALEEAANLSGAFYFREQILDDLDYYMTCIKRMKVVDPEAYGLYAQLGAHLLPKEGMIINELTPWWKTNRPGFGAVAWTHNWLDEENKKEKALTPRFWYFHKYKYKEYLRHQLVQPPPHGSDIYSVVTYWDQPRDKKWKKPIPTEFLIAITRDHRLVPLREYTVSETTAVSRHKRWQPGQVRGKRSGGRVRTVNWEIHRFYRDWAKEHNVQVEQFMTWLFCTAASMYEAANSSMIRVEAGKHGHAAVFGVDIKRTPYFFKDRGVTLNDRGNRKRIFHIVQPHTRINGATVPMHFRGERQFNWNGFDVRITVPGLHHAAIAEFNVASTVYEKDTILPPGQYNPKQVGAWLHSGVAGLDGVPNSMKNQPSLPPLPKTAASSK